MMRRKVGKLLGDRRVVGGFLLLMQLAIVMFGVSWASMEYHWLTPALTVLSVIIVIWLVRKYDNPMYKITWMLVIVLLPLFGGLFYLFWGNTPLNRARTQHQYEPKPPVLKFSLCRSFLNPCFTFPSFRLAKKASLSKSERIGTNSSWFMTL